MARPMLSGRVPGRAWILRAALPIMAANIATPLVGIVDVALIGRNGGSDVSPPSPGALVFNILFWTFGSADGHHCADRPGRWRRR